jgi:hypothetical protein
MAFMASGFHFCSAENFEVKVMNIDVCFFDEHRIGLKPIIKKVWSKIWIRPIALVQHRYEWLYVYGFVNPKQEKLYGI